jgi:hypothetical protein
MGPPHVTTKNAPISFPFSRICNCHSPLISRVRDNEKHVCNLCQAGFFPNTPVRCDQIFANKNNGRDREYNNKINSRKLAWKSEIQKWPNLTF